MEEEGRLSVDGPDIDAAQLIDEEARRDTAQLDLGPEDGRLCLRRRRNDRDHAPGHVGGAQDQAVSPAALLVSATGVAEIDPVDGATDHQTSDSADRSSSDSR